MADSRKGKKPEEKFGTHGVWVSVFANDVKNRSTPMYSATPQRAFRRGNKFDHVSSFTTAEIPVLIKKLNEAWTYMLEREKEDWKDSRDE